MLREAGQPGRTLVPEQGLLTLRCFLPLRPVHHPQEAKPDKSSPYVQVLEGDWRQALRDHQEQADTILSLRKALRRGEALHARVCGRLG